MQINEGRQKSRSLRRVSKRTPKGTVVVHYVTRQSAKPKCSGCGKILHGVPRAHSSKLGKIAKSQRRPQRPFGGVLCSSCSRKAIISKYRNIFSLSKK